jgi:hypothetical protein
MSIQAEPPRVGAPSWLRALRADPAIAGLGVSWLTEPAAAPGGDGAPHLAMLATGPVRPAAGGVGLAAGWYVDGWRRRRLLLAPGPGYPPSLWIEVDATAAGMAKALAGLFPARRPARVELPRVVRRLAGRLAELPGPLDRLLPRDPFVEPGCWGSAHPDDPGAGAGDRRAQGEAVPSLTWGTALTGSRLTVEAHRGELLVVEARYRPAPHAAPVERVNRALGRDLPIDLPVDLAGALMPWELRPAEDLERGLAGERDPAARVRALEGLAALWHGSLDDGVRLRSFLGDPDPHVRVELANLAISYGLEFLLEELALVEPEPAIVDQLQRRLDEGVGYRHPNVFAERGGGAAGR